jgi:hypothetical protein
MAEAVCSQPGAAVEADTAPAYPPASPAPAGNISEKFYDLKNFRFKLSMLYDTKDKFPT